MQLAFVGTKGNASNVANYTNAVRKSVDAHDRAYDILGAYSLSVASCAQNGLTLDLLSLPYLNFDMPWWPEKLIEQAVIKDKLYFASGDISANVIYMMYVTFFNKSIAEDYNLASPYDLVLNDEWTMDKMFELSTGVYQDLDGDGVKSEGDSSACTQLNSTLMLSSGAAAPRCSSTRGKKDWSITRIFTVNGHKICWKVCAPSSTTPTTAT